MTDPNATNTAAPPVVVATDPAELVAPLASTMPTPTAPARESTGTPPPPPRPPELKTTFDPTKHAANPDGSPKFDALGRYYSRNLGRKKVTPAAPPPPASFIPADAPQPGTLPTSPAAPALNGTVETCIGVFQTILVFIGEEEGILSDTEKAILRPPIERILAKYQIGADILPPELELALAVVAIVIERIKKGRKFATWFAKVRAWAIGMFFRQKGAAFGGTIRREVKPDLVDVLAADLKSARDEVAAMRAKLEAEAAERVAA